MGRILTTYEIVTPESAEEGDVAERGWRDEEGEVLSPAQAVRFLEDKGASQPSSTHFHPGIWYSNEPEQDYSDGSYETESYHLKGYTPNQQKSIYYALMRRAPLRARKRNTSYGQRMREMHRKHTKIHRSR